MSLIDDVIVQLKNRAPVLIIVYVVLFSLLFFVMVIAEHYHIGLAYLTRDTTAVLHVKPYVGIISNIGILFWSATVAISFFASVILSRRKSVKMATFLLFSSLLTLVLLLDDLFMFHEYIFPKYFHIAQNMVYVGYFSLILIYLIKFRNVIFQTEFIVLFLAFTFFGLSIICDLVLPLSNMEYLIEDGFKLFGIITWFIFFTRISFTEIQKIIESNKY